MMIVLLVMFFLQGEPQPLFQSYPQPDLKTCEAQAHLIGKGSIPKELQGHQVNGMGAMCLRVLPSGHDI